MRFVAAAQLLGIFGCALCVEFFPSQVALQEYRRQLQWSTNRAGSSKGLALEVETGLELGEFALWVDGRLASVTGLSGQEESGNMRGYRVPSGSAALVPWEKQRSLSATN